MAAPPGRSGGPACAGSTAQPCPCPAARLRGEKRFPRPPPPAYFPGAPGRFPRGLFAWKMRKQRQAKIYFYGRSLWGRPRPSFPRTHPPPRATNPEMPSPRAGAGAAPRPSPLPRPAPACPARGKRPRKETFPSMIVLPLAERVMKILGKCYTTRGCPFGAKFPEKPGRFPGGEGRGWGRRYLPESTSASSAVPPRLPPSRAGRRRNVSPKII